MPWTLLVSSIFSQRSKWPVTRTGFMKMRRCGHPWFSSKASAVALHDGTSSVQFERHTSTRETDVILRNPQLFAGIARIQRGHRQRHMAIMDFKNPPDKVLRIRTRTVDEGPTLQTHLKQISSEGNIHWSVKTIKETKYPSRELRTSWFRNKNSQVMLGPLTYSRAAQRQNQDNQDQNGQTGAPVMPATL